MNGTILDTNLEIDFSRLKKDLVEIGRSRLLHQFQNSQVLCELLSYLLEEMQELYDALIGVMEGRTTALAQGANLDVIGRIVGQERILLNAADKVYFTWDENGDATWDDGPWYVENAPIFGNLPASDFEYRQLIISKIFKNHVKYCSVPEILTFVRLVYGINVSIRRVGPMDIDLIVPSDTPSGIIASLSSFVDNEFADQQYFLPLPATIRINQVILLPESPFTYDDDTFTWDQSDWPVGV